MNQFWLIYNYNTISIIKDKTKTYTDNKSLTNVKKKTNKKTEQMLKPFSIINTLL